MKRGNAAYALPIWDTGEAYSALTGAEESLSDGVGATSQKVANTTIAAGERAFELREPLKDLATRAAMAPPEEAIRGTAALFDPPIGVNHEHAESIGIHGK